MGQLINCIECGKSVSSSVTQCIHCGKDPHPHYVKCFVCEGTFKKAECIKKREIDFQHYPFAVYQHMCKKCFDNICQHSDLQQFRCPTCHTIYDYQHFSSPQCPHCGEKLYLKNCIFCEQPVEGRNADVISYGYEFPVSFYAHKHCYNIFENYNRIRYIESPSPKKEGGCYIATTCYGSYNAHEVRILRQYRDETLSQSSLGRMLIRIYYTYSPYIADRLKNAPRLNNFVKTYVLDNIVTFLNKRR